MENTEMITTELQKFNLPDAAIAEYKEKYMPLTIKDLDDKEGYQAVKLARLFIKAKRVEVKKTGENLRADAVAFQKAVIGEEKRLTDLLKPIEDHLESQEDFYEKEKERIKQEKIRAEQEKVNKRTAVLIENGLAFNGTSFSIGEISISTEDLKTLNEIEFANFISKAELIHAEIEAGKAEAERARLAEAERIKEEQEAEKLRLAEVKKEQDAKEAEFQKREAELKAKEEAIAAEQKRVDDEKKAAELAKQKEEQEKSRLAELEKARAEAAEKAKRDEQERAKREKEAAEEKERKAKAAAARKEALKPDREKLLHFANVLMPELAMKVPILNDEKASHIMHDAMTKLDAVSKFIIESIETL